MLPLHFRNKLNSDLPKIYRVFKHGYSVATDANEQIEPIKMAFASYENTTSEAAPPPFVIMHGLFGSKSNWNSLSKVYHQKILPPRKVIAVDARNHGDSPHSPNHTYAHLAEDIKAFMAQMNIKKASLMGHSMGGRAVMLFALKYPELVDKLIVADISPCKSSPSLHSMMALFELLQAINLPKDGAVSVARANVDQQLSKRVNDPGLRAFLMTNLVKKSDGSYGWRINIPALNSNFIRNIAVFPEPDGATFDGPVLFIGGGASDYIQKSDHPDILQIFPNASFRYIEGAGHWLHSENPSQFLRITLDFLNRGET